MDIQKTGVLVSEARKEKGFTQKQLAEQLHISDRTISKWERGAGFPDVALLEPLAAALDISVVSLLQGERVTSPETEISVRNAIAIVCKQMRAKTRKRLGIIIASTFLTIFYLGFIYMILDYTGVFLKNISLEIPVSIYVDGVIVDDSTIVISGKRNTVNNNSYEGQFAIEYVEETAREGVKAYIEWNDELGYEHIRFHAYGGAWDCGVQYLLYVTEDMTQLALKLDNGTIIATDDYYASLLMLDDYYPLRY